MTAYTEKQYVEEMIATRRKIHQTPEEGWTEFQTTWLVAERLRALGLKVLLGTQVINPKAVMGRDPKLVEAAIKRALAAGVPQSFIDETGGYTGAVAVLETGRPGPVTAFRSDMDCVLVTESDSPDHLPTACGLCMPAATTDTLLLHLKSAAGSLITRISSKAPSRCSSSRPKKVSAAQAPWLPRAWLTMLTL